MQGYPNSPKEWRIWKHFWNTTSSIRDMGSIVQPSALNLYIFSSDVNYELWYVSWVSLLYCTFPHSRLRSSLHHLPMSQQLHHRSITHISTTNWTHQLPWHSYKTRYSTSASESSHHCICAFVLHLLLRKIALIFRCLSPACLTSRISFPILSLSLRISYHIFLSY